MKGKHVWVCSRCVRERPLEETIGQRMRYAGETCPTCADPGVGMAMLARCRIADCGKPRIDDKWSTCEEHSKCVALGCEVRRVNELAPFCGTHARDAALAAAWKEL